LQSFIHLYRLVSDNIDIEVHSRIQSESNRNKSLHWTQQYGILDKVLDNTLSDQRPQKAMNDVHLADLLPGPGVHDNLITRWAVLVSRVICKYLPKFKHLQDVVIHHITHPFSDVMAAKSEMVFSPHEYEIFYYLNNQ
jgi:hypothetical protein